MNDVTSAWLAALRKLLRSTGQLVRDQPKGGNPMNNFRLAWAALKNMMRAAAHDPLWAFVAIVTGPFRAAGYVLRMGVFFLIVLAVVGGGLFTLMQWAGIQRGDALWYVGNIAFTAFLALLAFRLVSLPLIQNFGDMGSDTHGSARFATDKEARPLTRSKAGLLIGRDPKSKKLMRYDGPMHLLTMAPTRTGKGVGTVIPNLLTADRSVICIDPKGENAVIAGRARQKFGPVHVLDPFGITGKPSAAFNPLDTLDPDGLDVAEDATTLADALVYDDPATTSEPHWNDEAKALIAGIILHVVTTEPRDRRTLATLRDNITLAPDAFAALLKAMQASTAAHGLVARAANRHLGKSDKEA
ncbi:MAG: type IV secretory system conjugative DNA transfer family protein, partial [Gemmataceae bacterium]|nr:type IV secretory system conjugative DNA transfer family protein [Gemmataceae bacterium]